MNHLVAATADHASTWLEVLPTSPELTLTEAEFIQAAHLRLTIRPKFPKVCSGCNKGPFQEDPWHVLSCNRLHGSLHTMRHNTIIDILKKWAIRVGVNWVITEPADLDPDTDIRPDMLFFCEHLMLITVVRIVGLNQQCSLYSICRGNSGWLRPRSHKASSCAATFRGGSYFLYISSPAIQEDYHRGDIHCSAKEQCYYHDSKFFQIQGSTLPELMQPFHNILPLLSFQT